MVIKDKIAIWFIKNIVLPRNEIIDTPGFLVLKFSEEYEKTNIREILLPDYLFVNIENEIVKKFKKRGRQVLYSIGKKFGYRYADITNATKLEKDSKKKFEDFCHNLVRYMESIYSSKIKHELDIKNKIAHFWFKDYIVCKENGIGLILTDGAIGGIWSFIVSDPTAEAVQRKCQGRGNRFCELISGPRKTLEKMKIKTFKENNLSNLSLENLYNRFNTVYPTNYSKTSFKSLIDSGYFTQRTGIIKHNNHRFLLIESSIMYILESNLKRLPGGNEKLFDISFDFGRKLVLEDKPEIITNYAMDLLCAFGFGDVLLTKVGNEYKISFDYFPWTKFAKSVDFSIIRGLLSGMISGFENKKIIFNKTIKDFSKGYMSLVLKR